MISKYVGRMILFKKRFQYLIFVVAVIVVSAICALIIRVVFADWSEPGNSPPEDNVPGPIWNNSGPVQDAYFKVKGGVFGDETGGRTVIGAWTDQSAGDITTDGKIVAHGNVMANKFCLGVDGTNCIDNWNTMAADLQQVTDKGNITTKSIKIQDNDLYLSDGKAIRVDLDNANSVLNIGNWGAGDKNVDVKIFGGLTTTDSIYSNSDLIVDGRVGIGDKDPYYYSSRVLTVNGGVVVHNSIGNKFLDLDLVNKIIKIGDMDTTNGANLTIDANNSGRFVFQNGNVGIGTDTPTAKLEVEGATNLKGSLSVSGCFGPTYFNMTAESLPGDLKGKKGGYRTVNALCDSEYHGSHVCTSAEILNSISCNSPAIENASGSAWINNGPPGYTAVSNDCRGWTSSSSSAGIVYGIFWSFSPSGADNSGMGWLTTCNVEKKFACCK